MRGPIHVIRHPAPPGVDFQVHDLILTAIHGKRLLRFTYKGLPRIVEPHDYGVQNNVVNLFSYQTGGQSSSGHLPEWRKFAVPSISRLELMEQDFSGSRAVPSQNHQEWDVLFARVSQ
jgi:hypothetical protein